MARAVACRGAVLAGMLLSSVHVSAASQQVLQYDAVIEGALEAGPESMRFGLFMRYHLHGDSTTGEVVHYEPGWNQHAFTWNPLGLGFHASPDGVRFESTFRDVLIDAPAPDGPRGAVQPNTYSPSDLAHTHSEMLARIATFREAVGAGPGHDLPVEIEFQGDRITRVVWNAPEDEALRTQGTSAYRYNADGGLSSIRTHSPPVEIPVEGERTVVDHSTGEARVEQLTGEYPASGRDARVVFEEVPVGEGTMRMPVHIEVRRSDNGDFIRSARHDNFQLRTLEPDEPMPWETWENARFSQAESDRIWLLADERYWLGERSPSPEHAAFFAGFLIPLQELEEQHEDLAFRLRAFFHAYNAAMVLEDREYLLEGFPWYMEQIASLESPMLLLHAGQECIRLLIRWGYHQEAESAFDAWRNAVFALDEDVRKPFVAEYAVRGTSYYAYRLLDPAGEDSRTAAERFQYQYWRCMVLKRLGEMPRRDLVAAQGRADPSWAALTAEEWTDMVSEEFQRSVELFFALGDAPTQDQQRMQEAMETLYIAAQAGDGFHEPDTEK